MAIPPVPAVGWRKTQPGFNTEPVNSLIRVLRRGRSGIIGAVVVWWILFVVYYAVLISFDEDRMAVRDRVSWVIMTSVAVLIQTLFCCRYS